jgi:hypothetical protein
MSGYLQRLVSSAIKPMAGVHPVIAPLFSMQHGTASEDLAEPAAPGIAPRMFTHVETGRDPLSASANVDAIPPNPRSVATAMMRGPSQGFSSPHTTPSTAQVPEEPWQKHASTLGEGAAPVEAASTQSVYIPLLPEKVSTVSLPAVDSHPASPLAATSRAGRDVADRVRSSRSNKREPDEIQITIGRIEVTAVPEAPARPVPKPGRKQLSLDEYLRRADGRGR